MAKVIYVADDEKNIRELLQVFLRDSGYAVDIFNNGQEISQEDMPHIFERFYKGANGGHGIGLAIAKEVIQAHKGKIAVRNENGVYFTIRLKRAK